MGQFGGVDIDQIYGPDWQAALDRLYQSQMPDYLAGYKPAYLANPVTPGAKDLQWGIVRDGQLIGAFWLTGWGTKAPSVGVIIDQAYSGHGLGRVAVQIALATAQLNGANKVTAQVSQAHARAYNLFVGTGFRPVGVAAGASVAMEYEFAGHRGPAPYSDMAAFKAAIESKYGFTVPDDYARDFIKFVEDLRWPAIQL